MTIACAAIPALPLQLLRRRHPEWRPHPTVVVDVDSPRGIILWADERARRQSILPGQRYAHALGLARDLRAGVISEQELREEAERLADLLYRWSPSIERTEPPESFWLDGTGLRSLFPSLEHWGKSIHTTLEDERLQCFVVVGMSRFGTYALARSESRKTKYARKVQIYEERSREERAMRSVPLDRLDIQPRLRDAMSRLGVRHLGEFLELPINGLLERFGTEAASLHQLASYQKWDPLDAASAPEPEDERVHFDEPEHQIDRLLFAIKAVLDRLIARLIPKQRAIDTLSVELTLRYFGRLEGRNSEIKTHTLRAASPSLDHRTWLRLCHLRLESDPPDTGVSMIRVWAADVPVHPEQQKLLVQRPRREFHAASEALAALRAELGEDAVVRAVLRDGHLPEANFGWETLRVVLPPQPKRTLERSLIRRIATKPKRLPPPPPNVRNDGYIVAGVEQGSVTRLNGPYLISGGWWLHAIQTTGITRDYYFAETRKGHWLWLYFDRRRRRWFQQGSIE